MSTSAHTKTAVLALAALALTLAWATASADEAPPTRERWILEMDHGPLRTTVVRDAAGAQTAYHYMTIKVKNGTPFARHWHPVVKAITDTKKSYLAGGYAQALSAIRLAERNPNLLSINATAGKLAAGKTIETVAIFGPLDPLYDRINVQIYGLVDPIAIYKIEQYGDQSGEDNVVLGAQSVIVDSAYWDRNQKILSALKKAATESGSDMPQPKVEYQEVAEQRYWSMDYERLGDEFNAEDDIIRFKAQGWKVKGDPKGLRVISTEG